MSQKRRASSQQEETYSSSFSSSSTRQHGNVIYGVNAHDVLSGRGISVAHHAGNERFRALVQARYDPNWCRSYTALEKRAVAEGIIAHIQSMTPPGRFLRRYGRSRKARGLDGPWEELSAEETIKKTCQALRDCNRLDRTGYAAYVSVPEDVQANQHQRTETGMTNKELAILAAEEAKQAVEEQTTACKQHEDSPEKVPTDENPSGEAAAAAAAAPASPASSEDAKRDRQEKDYDDEEEKPSVAAVASAVLGSTFISETPSMSGIAQASWFKKQRADATTPVPRATPATAASTGGITSMADDDQGRAGLDEDDDDDYTPVAAAAATLLSPHHPMSSSSSPGPAGHLSFSAVDDAFGATFAEDSKMAAGVARLEQFDPLHLAAEAAAAMGEQDTLLSNEHGEFGPPSPMDPDPDPDRHHDHDHHLSDDDF